MTRAELERVPERVPVEGPLVVWSLGDALLAVPVAAVEEVVPVDDTGRVHARAGELDLAPASLLRVVSRPSHAVVVRAAAEAGERRLALPADRVEGVLGADRAAGIPAPGWLDGIEAPHIASLVRLDTGRVAALLDVAELFRAS